MILKTGAVNLLPTAQHLHSLPNFLKEQLNNAYLDAISSPVTMTPILAAPLEIGRHLGCQSVGQFYVFPVQLFGRENARRRHRGGRKNGFIKARSQICCNVSLQSRPTYLMPSQPLEPLSRLDPAELFCVSSV